MEGTRMQMKVYTPVDNPSDGHSVLSMRPKSLEGARVALLDNGKEFSDVVLEALAEVLKREYRVAETVFWRKGFPAKGAPFIDEMVPTCDVAISGVGHCGSSSPWSVLDAAALEERGVPAVALISRSFCPLSQVVARSAGYPGLPIVMLQHPIGDADQGQIKIKGVNAVAECVRVLTSDIDALSREFERKEFIPPEHAVPKY